MLENLNRTGAVIHSISKSTGLSPSSQEDLGLHLHCVPAACSTRGWRVAGSVSPCHALGTPAEWQLQAGVLCSSSMGHLIQPSKGHSAAAVLNTVLKRGPVTHMLLLTFAAIAERK